MRKKMSDAESDRIFRLTHEVGMTMDQVMDQLLQDVKAMSPDEKSHLRSKMNRSLGILPKTADGKPS